MGAKKKRSEGCRLRGKGEGLNWAIGSERERKKKKTPALSTVEEGKRKRQDTKDTLWRGWDCPRYKKKKREMNNHARAD